MAFNLEDVKELAVDVIQKKVPTSFAQECTLEDVEETLREACRELAPTYYEYERNKTYIFEIIQTAIDVALPQNVLPVIGQFAEIQQFENGKIPRFEIKAGKNRAKKFVTKVALSGIYETFRLDKRYVDVTTSAYGGAAAIDFERYLSGEEDFGEYTSTIIEGLADAIYKEIWTALTSAATTLGKIGDGTTNYADVTGDGETWSTTEAGQILKLVTTAKRYSNGNGAMIVATEPVLQKFTNSIGNDFTPNTASSDLEELKQFGVIGKWTGNTLVELPNSFEDETNTTTVFGDEYAFVFPNNKKGKVVLVALEGPTQVDDFKNRDRSMELQAYKKFGVAIVTYNDWCMFKVSSLASED